MFLESRIFCQGIPVSCFFQALVLNQSLAASLFARRGENGYSKYCGYQSEAKGGPPEWPNKLTAKARLLNPST